MRLLYVSADPGVPPLGAKGCSVHVRELVAAFAATGASVVVASPRTDADGERLHGATLVGIPAPALHRSTMTSPSRSSLDVSVDEVAAGAISGSAVS